ncbi:DUF1456 family protein [Pseudomonas sp. PDM16]|uniref:DUF1456 family protein n=1 Tax=Pseudomonas sp. PDM16 TaxID=2769292 RepID=UPI00177AC488|nr:DUF1456 family protein [Pseudomonas sp. PDM16]MBD9414519.1 DUF1456 family protein [Pseudomonas sp. PDM16]
MNNNDVLRSLRYLLDISDAQVADICRLAGYELAADAVEPLLKKDDEEGQQPCSDEVLAHFLDGLVFHKRGKDDSRPAQPVAKRLTNNIILKKLRVAFELRDEDMHEILRAADLPMTKAELSALFRSPEHKNYRVCGDQLLRNFLRGLTQRQRG